MSNTTTTTTTTNTNESFKFLEDDFLQFSPIIETNKFLINSNNITNDFEFIQEIDNSQIDSFFININSNQENEKPINSNNNSNTIYELEPDEELTIDENDINFYDDEFKKINEFNINITLPDLISDPVSDISTAPSSADSETFNENINNFNIINNSNKNTKLFNNFMNSSVSSSASSSSASPSSSNFGFRDINRMNIRTKKRSKSAIDIPIFNNNNNNIHLKPLSEKGKIQIKDELISPILNKNLEFKKFKPQPLSLLSSYNNPNITTNTTANTTTTTTTTTNTTTIASNPFYKPPAILRRLSEADGYKISKNYKKFNSRK
ncbi:hypothetical protein B5S28_g4102 [[Candida] boidinii]|nr:hypothetical protein B5S28_g4102 [[Candida] boidinii]